jgi:hypothetical protein
VQEGEDPDELVRAEKLRLFLYYKAGF